MVLGNISVPHVDLTVWSNHRVLHTLTITKNTTILDYDFAEPTFQPRGDASPTYLRDQMEKVVANHKLQKPTCSRSW